MSRRPPVEVVVAVDDAELSAGTLWIHQRGETSATFRYSDEYLGHHAAYALDPALPLASGAFHTPAGISVFAAFADGAPDRWGRNLMRREENERARSTNTTPRTLSEADFLLGVRDDVRQGAIRFRNPETGSYYSVHRGAVPRLIDMARLLRAIDHLNDIEAADQDIKDLIAAGSSLGGARPKSAVVTHTGHLAIAKFPRKGSDEFDVIAWEKLELDLARRAGLIVAMACIVSAGNRNALVVQRFDRNDGRRIGFCSALTLLEASDGEQRSYLEIGEAIERLSPQPATDLRELFGRMVFSVLTGNTDDHLRNHGFLRSGHGWRLSPAYDLNPNPDRPDRLSTAIDLDDTTGGIETALSVSTYFRLSLSDAKAIVANVEAATRDWYHAARQCGIPTSEIDLMRVAFDSDQRRIARAVQ